MSPADLLIVLSLLLCRCHGQDYPFRNTSLSFEDRVKVKIPCVASRQRDPVQLLRYYVTQKFNGRLGSLILYLILYQYKYYYEQFRISKFPATLIRLSVNFPFPNATNYKSYSFIMLVDGYYN